MFVKILVTTDSKLDGHPDEAIPGTYEAEVDDDLAADKIASAALDGFHGSFGIEELDHFAITVHDSETGAEMAELDDAVGGQLESRCRMVAKISDDPDQSCVDALSPPVSASVARPKM